MDAWGEVERAMGKVVKAAREQGWVRELDRIRHEIVWREDQAWFWAQVRQVAVCQAIDAILEDEGLLLAEGAARRWTWREELELMERAVEDPENTWWDPERVGIPGA